MRWAARTTTLILAASALAAGAPLGAHAQSPCGESVTVTVGDTLHAIAERCNTSVAALLGANPDIADPDVITVGQELTLPAEEEAEAGDGEDADSAKGIYEVESGDTLYAIAETFGTSAQAVIEANPGLDPESIPIGRIIAAPGGDEARDGEPAVRVGAEQAAPGERALVRAEGFPAGARVEIGIGPPQSEFDVVARARADSRGRVRQAVDIPGWAAQQRSLVFVVQTPGAAVRATSEPLAVAAELAGGSPD